MNHRLEILKLRTLRTISRLFFPGYQLTWPDLAWYDQLLLREGLQKFGESNGFNTHRRLFVQQAARLIKAIPGDTAECGVYKGLGSWLISQTAGKIHHGFDSFQGLSMPNGHDGTYWKTGDLKSSVDVAREQLRDCKDVLLYPGWIPHRFADVQDRRFALIHIDVDLCYPTFESLKFFYPRLNALGILICDDYGSLRCPGATLACDEYLKDKPEKMIYLPGGGGFIIRSYVTACDTSST